MTTFENRTAEIPGTPEVAGMVAIVVEQLTVYCYHVPDAADDPGAIALERFLAGDAPDSGPADGEQHDLTTYYVGDVEPTAPANYGAWLRTYRPVTNPHRAAPYEGTLFETVGPELDAVKAADPACVWTLVSGDDDSMLILNGFHFANRLGYFVTMYPWRGNEDIEITFD